MLQKLTNPGLSLAQKIIIPFVCLLLSMTLIGTLGFGYWVSQTMEDRTWDALTDLAVPLAGDINEREEQILFLARTLAGDEALRNAVELKDETQLRQLLLPVRASNGIELIKVVDATGQPLFQTESQDLSQDISGEVFNLSQTITQTTSGMILADIVRSRDSSKLLAVSAVPVKSTQGIVGGLIFGELLDDQFLRSLPQSASKHPTMIIGGGQTFASTFAGGSDQVPKDAISQGSRFKVTALGYPYVGGTFPLTVQGRDSGFHVIIMNNVHDEQEMLTQFWRRLAGYFLAGAVLALLIGLVIARGISAPVVALSKAATRFAAGDEAVRADVKTNDEVGTLGKAFNSMVDALEASKQKVNAAYAELEGNHKELVRAHNQVRTLLEASSALTTTLQFQPLMDTIGRVLLNIGSAETVWLLSVDHEARQIVGHAMFTRGHNPTSWLPPSFSALGERCRFPIDGLSNSITRSVFTKTPVFYKNIWDMSAEERIAVFGCEVEGLFAFASLGVLPLVEDDQVVAIAVLIKANPAGFGEEQQDSMRTFANTAALALRNALLFAEVERLGTTDALTQLNNHRAIQEILVEEYERAVRYSRPLSVMMIDVDNFKLFNDTFGHLTGDQVLRRVAQILTSTCRSSDRIGRYGGDEFIIILPETDEIQVRAMAERILAELSKEHIAVGENERVPVNCSIGVASYPGEATSQHDLLEQADAAMYQAKRSGGGGLSSHRRESETHLILGSSWNVLDGLITAVDNKDRYTREHSDAVSYYALGLAEEMGLGTNSCEQLRVAALLHDVGKIGVPDRILRKPGPLTPDERQIVEQHPSFGVMLMNQIPFSEIILDAIKYHHERYDGRGYPEGLKSDEIPIMARILAVVDAFAAMVTDRPYRKALPLDKAIGQLRRHAGSQFDPQVVEAFLLVLEASEGQSENGNGKVKGSRPMGELA